MPISDLEFSFKFFRPSHRTVAVHNGLLSTRTKHTIARDRLVVAEQRFLDAERRKSASNLQSLAFEQKQFEKKFASLHHQVHSITTERPVRMRDRSSSDVVLPHIRPVIPLTGSLPNRLSKLSVSLNDDKHNLLALPKLVDSGRRLSVFSDGDASDKSFFTSDMESDDEGETAADLRRTTAKRVELPRLMQKAIQLLPPIVSVIPPEEDVLFLPRTDFSSSRSYPLEAVQMSPTRGRSMTNSELKVPNFRSSERQEPSH